MSILNFFMPTRLVLTPVSRSIFIAVSLLNIMIVSACRTAVLAESKTGRDSVEKLIAIFKSWDSDAVPKQVFNDAAKYIDYSSMSEQALGTDQWSKLKPEERNAFTTALRKLIEDRYYPRWHKLFSRGSLTYGSESTIHGDIMLNSVLKLNNKAQNVTWQLDSKSPAPAVVSLKVDQKDLLTTLHDRISPKLQKSGFKALLSWLQNRAAKESESN